MYLLSVWIIKQISLLKAFKKPPIPVICIGNIYLGGTGKTPMCIEIFAILKNLNMRPGFVRKEYSSFQDEVNLQKKIGVKLLYVYKDGRCDWNGKN